MDNFNVHFSACLAYRVDPLLFTGRTIHLCLFPACCKCFSDKWSVLGHFTHLDNKLVIKGPINCLDQIFWIFGVGLVILWPLVYFQVVKMKIIPEILIFSFSALFFCKCTLHIFFLTVSTWLTNTGSWMASSLKWKWYRKPTRLTIEQWRVNYFPKKWADCTSSLGQSYQIIWSWSLAHRNFEYCLQTKEKKQKQKNIQLQKIIFFSCFRLFGILA